MTSEFRVLRGQLCEFSINELEPGKKEKSVKILGQPLISYDDKECKELFRYVCSSLVHVRRVDVITTPPDMNRWVFSCLMNENIMDCIRETAVMAEGHQIAIHHNGPMLYYNLLDSEGNLITAYEKPHHFLRKTSSTPTKNLFKTTSVSIDPVIDELLSFHRK